jgi:curved DNA-binding protein CbpA
MPKHKLAPQTVESNIFSVFMHGQLSEHPLAELISEINVRKLSGALRLQRARVKFVFYFEMGVPVFAVSNVRVHRLADCLPRWGLVSAEQLEGPSKQASDAELGRTLVESGVLSVSDLEKALARQVADILRTALLWEDGGWEFDAQVRLTAEKMRVAIEADELLMALARSLPLESIRARLSDMDEMLSPEVSVAMNRKLLREEAFVLSRIDAPVPLRDLIAVSGLPEETTVRAVYALILGGVLDRANKGKVLLDIRQTAPTKGAARPKTTPLKTSSGVTESKKIAEPSTTTAAAQTDSAKATEIDERRALDGYLARLDEAENFYQLLDVSQTAAPDELKRAYHLLARRFHPDRFHQEKNAPLRARIESAFARVAQAYETLKDERSKAAYDAKLGIARRAAHAVEDSTAPPPAQPNQHAPMNVLTTESPAQPSQTRAPNNVIGQTSQHSATTAPPNAEQIFRRGIDAMREGASALAVKCFEEAARLMPHQPRYRAQYGQSLATNPKTRHKAEAEMQAAITLDAHNAKYRVMLAELYCDIGLLKRARGEIDRALKLDPRNAEAQRLLTKLKGKG